MTTTNTENHIETLRQRLVQLADQWGSHLDFWDFIGAEAGIAARGAYNFATGRPNAQNSRLSTIRGIEAALQVAEQHLAARQNALCQ